MSGYDTLMNFDQESRIDRLEKQVRELQRTVGKLSEWIVYLSKRNVVIRTKDGQNDTDTI